MEFDPVLIGILLVLAGFLVIFVGAAQSGSVEAGGVIFLGPIPIPIGSRRLWLPALIVGGIIIGLFYLARFT